MLLHVVTICIVASPHLRIIHCRMGRWLIRMMVNPDIRQLHGPAKDGRQGGISHCHVCGRPCVCQARRTPACRNRSAMVSIRRDDHHPACLRVQLAATGCIPRRLWLRRGVTIHSRNRVPAAPLRFTAAAGVRIEIGVLSRSATATRSQRSSPARARCPVGARRLEPRRSSRFTPTLHTGRSSAPSKCPRARATRAVRRCLRRRARQRHDHGPVIRRACVEDPAG